MKKTLIIATAVGLLTACTNNEAQLRERAAELCRYIPDHQLAQQSEDFMTADFYAVLDTMFNHLPGHDAMDHEWLYYFVTGNGGSTADYEVVGVEQTDETHAVATINVRQKWEDGSFDESSGTQQHKLDMEKVDGRWLMTDFDGHKAECRQHIADCRREQARRDAVCDYLAEVIGPQYRQGQLCIPTLMVVATENTDSTEARVWCDGWVWWYDVAGDTLKTISGGNHAGCMTLQTKDGKPVVTAFEQTVDGAGNDASARRIFGKHYDVYRDIHANDDFREAARREQLIDYVGRHQLSLRYYQDHGWPAKEL